MGNDAHAWILVVFCDNGPENPCIVECCVVSVLFCGRQSIGLRGDVENLDHPGNSGNWQGIIGFPAQVSIRKPSAQECYVCVPWNTK